MFIVTNSWINVPILNCVLFFRKLHLRLVLYCLLCVVLNNYVIKQIAGKSIHKLILFIGQNKR